MGEPGGLQSMGSQRVGHDWATSLSLFTFMHWRRRWHLTPVFLPGESQGQRSLVGCCLWGHTESDMTEATWQQQPPPNSAHNSKLFSASVIWCRKSYNLYHFLRVHIKQYHMIFVFLYLTLLSMIVLWWDPLNSWCILFFCRWLESITNSIDMNLSTLGDGEGQGNLGYCSPWGRKESDKI